MLSELSIRNFAIIDDLTIRFSDGLTIFSGETGAGKSIIINAVNLLLGSRASTKMIRTGAENAELEALFYLPENSPAQKVLAAHGYEESQELLIRRVISAKNRHKIYINDRLATMQRLTETTDNLAAISGQHEHQRLLKESSHLLILDQFAGLMPLRTEIRDCYHEILPLVQKLNDLQNSRQQQDEHIERLTYQRQEIDDAAILEGEDEQLKEELLRFKHAETLYQTVHNGVETLYNADGAVAERISEICKALEKAAGIDSALSKSAEALADIAVRIEDVADQLRAYSDSINFDDRRLEEIEARLDYLTRLKRKYGGSLESIFSYREKIERDLSQLENLSTEIEETGKALETKKAHLVERCRDLSEHRRNAADELARKIESELNSLKMKSTKFSVVFEDIPAAQTQSAYLCVEQTGISETGMERAKFMIAPNPGEELRPLSTIASGGELSRVILALKAIMADTDTSSTLIFDEVDAGIGGEVAEMVGKKLAELSRLHQVVCITHLAQIAKFGDHHHKISKETHDRRARTLIEKLSDEDRVEETARMISGAEITQTTRKHAREMLNER